MLKLLGLSFLLFTFTAKGQGMGGHDGGGGRGVVCYGAQGEIDSVELLDFFEGRLLEGYNIPDYPGEHQEIYQEIIKRSASEGILKTMKAAKRLESGFKFLPKGVRLNTVNDSSEIFIPRNCKIEQMANFQGISRIFIVTDFWDKLSETSKAGLLMHEFIWYMERQAGAATSSRARRTVARFFANNYQFEKIDHKVKLNDVYCSAHNPAHRSNEFTIGNSFFISKIEGSDSCLLSFDMLNSTLAYTKQTAVLEYCSDWEFEKVWYQNDSDDRIVTNISETIEIFSFPENLMSHEMTLYLDTEFDSNHKPKKKIFRIRVSNKEFPGYDEKTVELDCHPINESDLQEPWWL